MSRPARATLRSAAGRPTARTLAACALLTLLHLGGRSILGPNGPAPGLVSTVVAGSVIAEAAGVADEAACRLIITFQPDCPFCKSAAQAERRARRTGPSAHTTWVTDAERPSLALLQAELPAEARSLVDPRLYRALRVRAVPALYVLDAQNRVRWVGPYRGDEPEDLLDARCASPLPPATPAGGLDTSPPGAGAESPRLSVAPEPEVSHEA